MAILNAIPFGITANAAGFSDCTESVSITVRSDKAEAVDENGNIFSVSYYNKSGEYTASGYTAPSGMTIGAAGTTAITNLGSDATAAIHPGLTGASGATAGDLASSVVHVTEITVEEGAEDFQKYTIKGVFYEDITS